MIGIDIVDLTRIDINSESFRRHLLTEAEEAEYQQKRIDSRRREYIGGRFAAKEAIFKASGIQDVLSLSVLTGESGKPYVKDHPEIDVSISHDGSYAVAAAIVKEK